jgi:hypothetical protein
MKQILKTQKGGHTMETTISRSLDRGQIRVGEYSIAGNYDDGYTVWRTEDGEDSETLYDNISYEECIVWCLNKQNKS